MITEFYIIVNPKTKLIEDFDVLIGVSENVIRDRLNLRYTDLHQCVCDKPYGLYTKNHTMAVVKL